MDFFDDLEDRDGVRRVHGDRSAVQEGSGEEPVELGIRAPLGGDSARCAVDSQEPPRLLGLNAIRRVRRRQPGVERRLLAVQSPLGVAGA